MNDGHVPWSIKVHKGHFVLFHEIVKGIRREVYHGFAIFRMNFVQTPIVTIVYDFPSFPIASGKDPSNPLGVELPLVDVFRHVLLVRAQGVPHVDRNIIALQIRERNVEVQANLRRRVLVQCNGRGNTRARKGGRFRKEQHPHYHQGTHTHDGTQTGCLPHDVQRKIKRR